MVVDPAPVNLCSVRRNGNDAVPEAQITNELKRISKQVRRQKEQHGLIASTAVRIGFENGGADTSALQSKGTAQSSQSGSDDCDMLHAEILPFYLLNQ